MDPTNAKVSNHLPDDVSFSILSKLPLGSIKRFTCTHKSWAFLLENPNFMKMFRKRLISEHRSLYDETYLLRFDPAYPLSIFLHSGERFKNKVKFDLPSPFKDNVIRFQIWGYGINGFLCLSSMDHKIIGLWNPSTKEFNVLPPSLNEFRIPPINHEGPPPYYSTKSTLLGFGYSLIGDDYKLIHCLDFKQYHSIDSNIDTEDVQTCPDFLWEIYSLRSNSWRKIGVDIPYHYKTSIANTVCLNGVCHWLGGTNDHATYLVSFDLKNELVFSTNLPLEMHDNVDLRHAQRCLVVLNRSIAVISKYSMLPPLHISILGELGVKESWTKLFSIEPVSCIRPALEVKVADIFSQYYYNKLAFIDLTTQSMREISIDEKFLSYPITIYR